MGYKVEIKSNPKRYDMEKWLKDNKASSLYDKRCDDFGLFHTREHIIFKWTNGSDISILIKNFNQEVLWFINACNAGGANLSYPEELQDFDFVTTLLNSGKFISEDDRMIGKGTNTILTRKNEIGYFDNHGIIHYKKIEPTKENADLLIEMATANQQLIKRLNQLNYDMSYQEFELYLRKGGYNYREGTLYDRVFLGTDVFDIFVDYNWGGFQIHGSEQIFKFTIKNAGILINYKTSDFTVKCLIELLDKA